jgi:hypothetical protein
MSTIEFLIKKRIGHSKFTSKPAIIKNTGTMLRAIHKFTKKNSHLFSKSVCTIVFKYTLSATWCQCHYYSNGILRVWPYRWISFNLNSISISNCFINKCYTKHLTIKNKKLASFSTIKRKSVLSKKSNSCGINLFCIYYFVMKRLKFK